MPTSKSRTSSKRGSTKKSSSSKTGATTIPSRVDKDSSISVRKIENGFLVRESGSTGTGRNTKYYEKEFYSSTNPIQITGGGTKPSVKFGGKK